MILFLPALAGSKFPVKVSPMNDPLETVEMSDKQKAARKSRSKAIAFILVALVLIFYIVTVAKFDPNLLANRPI